MNIFHFIKKEEVKTNNVDISLEGYVPLIKATFNMLSQLYTDANGYDKYKELLESLGIKITERK